MSRKQKLEGIQLAKKMIAALLAKHPGFESDSSLTRLLIMECWYSIRFLYNTHGLSYHRLTGEIAFQVGIDAPSTIKRIIETFEMHMEGKSPDKYTMFGRYYRTWQKDFEKLTPEITEGKFPQQNMPSTYYKVWHHLSKNISHAA